jgi:hypothetical protein
VEQYHVFTSQMEDPKDEPWFGVEVNAVIQVGPQFMHWSDASITWGREDHPPLMPRPGGYALVLDPIMFSETHTCRFSRVLIDGGSSINLLYRTSMEKLRIPEIQLKPTKLTFHGIVSGTLVRRWGGSNWRCCLEKRTTIVVSQSGLRW